MNHQPTLSNDLVLIRPLANTDYSALYAVAKDPLIWEQHPARDRWKPDVFKAFFDASLQSKAAIVVIDQSDNSIIGSSRFKPLDNASDAIEIGWSFLSRNKWGGQYNKAVKQLMMDHAFQYVDKIIFYIGKDNLRSQKAVAKLGAAKIVESHLKYLTSSDAGNLTYIVWQSEWKRHRYGQ